MSKGTEWKSEGGEKRKGGSRTLPTQREINFNQTGRRRSGEDAYKMYQEKILNGL